LKTSEIFEKIITESNSLIFNNYMEISGMNGETTPEKERNHSNISRLLLLIFYWY
jgi:hypothetical protein